ncbi:hypothetical protein P170DRAFT_473196 [Aspergillus steynii IBT 23096]|uniref:pyruvate, water dikinase n=1 Tax=Aspergillus steynii IBT 23096 TaxID=1392250 RepID=A0A2I2GKF5_9EURO|nr:uncharacterized protein P170DRAFT_473196 [Aspergillus steynii IBT 23096]PLB53329.1 hypothetical protein P170DRAFT_473196 [Aspergillus steynii IBT 23096]
MPLLETIAIDRANKELQVGQHEDLVRNLEHVARDDVALAGGKNSSVGEMISALKEKGVKVPPGFATSLASWQYVDSNAIRDKIATLVTEWQATPVETAYTARKAFLRGNALCALKAQQSPRCATQYMAGERNPTLLVVPDIAEHAAERMRVLNILAQRRYRQRRKDRLHALESRVKSPWQVS